VLRQPALATLLLRGIGLAAIGVSGLVALAVAAGFAVSLYRALLGVSPAT
jgi:hypothetical protein